VLAKPVKMKEIQDALGQILTARAG
jgi:hypothetical protein